MFSDASFVYIGGAADMSERRTIRTHVRVTEDELRKLHEISESQHVSIAALFRECTLTPSGKHLTVILKADLNELSMIINDIDILVREALSILSGFYPVYCREEVTLGNKLEDIYKEYGKLRNVVSRKREVYHRIAASCLFGRKPGKVMEYQTDGKSRKGITVSVTEEEIKAIREIAEKSGCSISRLLKRNVLETYRNKRFTVDCDDLCEMNNRVKRHKDFLAAVVSDMKNRIVEDGEVEIIEQLLKSILEEITAKEESVRTDSKAIRKEIKERIRMEGK